MNKILMWIKHRLGWNVGIPESHYEGKKLIMCFKCECGKKRKTWYQLKYKIIEGFLVHQF